MDDELCWWPARQVARAIADGQLSAREYLRALLARIDRYDGALGLVVTRNERAEAEAAAADEAVVRGDPLPPLHGVAMTVKDSFATAGLRTTGGLLPDFVPDEDAAAVAGARRAGAIILGKTNLPRASRDLQAYNELFGTARNPWDPTLTTSGSSGGAAGALAAGFTPLEIGSDVAGSIRIPAGFCGVTGLKPTFGTVSMYGHVPPMPFNRALPDIAMVGPLARDVDDLEILFDAISGPDPWDRPAWRLSLPPASRPRRVAAWFDDPYCPVDGEVRAAVEQAADALAGTGVAVRATSPLGIRLEQSDQIFRKLIAGTAIDDISGEEAELIAAGMRPPTGVLGGEHVHQSHRDWVVANELRTRMGLRWRAFFSRYDALLLPVAPNTAPAHDHRPFAQRTITVDGQPRPYWDQLVWAGVTGMCYLPSVVVPVRLDARGVPIGVAVAGPRLGDRTVLETARVLARTLGPIGRPALGSGPSATPPDGARRELAAG
ncbi:amidase family protein [Micromonospora sp. WMMD712]|uniref:amidase family protein n=1 Tax=Micromonospora sp. WMMD712 TaxID=3016096 RepID=UPI00249BC429|nr:amidase family protein [Micromonospora sp. WMMD712]WFE59462.1 amidase family protein [Micromonospora sp. WMMD712]